MTLGLFLSVSVDDVKMLERDKTWILCAKLGKKESALKIKRHSEIKCVWVARKEMQMLIRKRYSSKLSFSER